MSFFEEFIIGLGQEILYDSFKGIGIVLKWIFYLGKKPISEIKKENWNTRIGFLTFLFLLLGIVFLVK